MGYSSDICRSFFIDPPKDNCKHHLAYSAGLGISRHFHPLLSFLKGKADSASQPTEPSIIESRNSLHALKLEIWSLVLAAQDSTVLTFTPAHTAADVDIAARGVISSAGYGKEFTHRVGHGIGIKAHESPYLNKGNTGTRLKPGMTFTSEPGVYLEGRFGVRHEDIFLVKDEGEEAECLSGKRATGPYDP